MEKFTRVEGPAASFPKPDIDTDAIIPAAWQRTLTGDPGQGLFGGWRYHLDGSENPDFILNQEPFRQARVIVGGMNFGCGSSREFAVWALMRFGIRCVIAPSFGDIFYENSFKNGLLPIILPPEEVERLHAHLAATNDPTIAVDLERCEIRLGNGQTLPFRIPAARRTALLEGLDEIGATLKFADDIDRFQGEQLVREPWVYAPTAVLRPK
ncbi:MAG: 3-isopropylmalate dehydratase small subunit [Alphaproteobacteria bacterium]|nr:3-isopropylmalate dehydratase small subunit [Alphaproteobacteria bacterium]